MSKTESSLIPREHLHLLCVPIDLWRDLGDDQPHPSKPLVTRTLGYLRQVRLRYPCDSIARLELVAFFRCRLGNDSETTIA